MVASVGDKVVHDTPDMLYVVMEQCKQAEKTDVFVQTMKKVVKQHDIMSLIFTLGLCRRILKMYTAFNEGKCGARFTSCCLLH